jgi:hypothetical protein
MNDRTLPAIEGDLPIALQIELKELETRADADLWAIAESRMNPEQVVFYDLLLDHHHKGVLSTEEREQLTKLREESDRFMVRKAHDVCLVETPGMHLTHTARTTCASYFCSQYNRNAKQ